MERLDSFRAAITNDMMLVSYLLDKGADINHLNITGLTALDIARNLGRNEMVDFLIKSGTKNEDRMLEHLVTYRQDWYVWDNDIAYAYYHWISDDGFSPFFDLWHRLSQQTIISFRFTSFLYS